MFSHIPSNVHEHTYGCIKKILRITINKLGKVHTCPKGIDLKNIFSNFLWEKKKNS